MAVVDKNRLCEFVIQCRIEEGTTIHVVNSKSELGESKWNIELRRKIPDELLIEILIRLPSKCVCRYRAVNKHWRNLISSNHFINRHVNHLRDLNGSHFIPNSFTLVFRNKFWCRSPTAGPDSSLEVVVPLHTDHVLCKSYNHRHYIPFKEDTTSTAAVASCRDLLLCTRIKSCSFYVANLMTKQLMALPPPPILGESQLPAKNRKPKLGILCYDSDDVVARGWCRFKVVVVSKPHEFGSSLFTLRIFCSESREWTKLVVDWYTRTTQNDFLSGGMVPHNGMLYWFNGYSIVSLDPFNGDSNLKLTHSINLPDGVVFHEVLPLKLGVSQGHLCLASFIREGGSSYIQVWQVEDYEKGLWRLLYKSRYTERFSILAFHPYRRDAIFVQKGHCVYLMVLENNDAEFDKYVEMKLDKDYLHVLMTRAVLLRHHWFPTPLPSSYPLVDPATSSLNPRSNDE